MRRIAYALGTTAVALALTGPPAAAAEDPLQQATDSTGVAQVGDIDVDTPVRVLSDGSNTGDAQVGGAELNVPLRLISPGNNAAARAEDPEATTPSPDAGTGASEPGETPPMADTGLSLLLMIAAALALMASGAALRGLEVKPR